MNSRGSRATPRHTLASASVLLVSALTGRALAEAPPASSPAAPSEADLAAEAVLRDVGNSATSDTRRLDIYGFADFTYVHALHKFAYALPYDTFAMGRFNLYFASELGDNWRSLAEIRFTYLPHGASVTSSSGTARVDTTVGDYTDLNRPLRWGGIVIERAWLEYSAHPLLKIRAGHWLTPYGIWNVDHGSPVIIGVRRPFIVGEALFPASQTGLELAGSYDIGALQVGYHLTLSNGRGPLDTYQDLNHDKALGGRLFAKADTWAGTFTTGLSLYEGRNTDRSQSFAPDASGAFTLKYPITADSRESSYGADVKWEFSSILVQGEAIAQETVYQGNRPAAFVLTGPPGYAPNFRRFGVYGLAGYRFRFGGIMPFAGGEYYSPGATVPKSAAFWGGLNVRPTPRVVLKAQYTYSWFTSGENLPPDGHYNSLDCQAAWSF